MREGVGVSGIRWSSWEDPVLEGSPLNLVLYMHLAYSSNILITNFDPMDSMLTSGTWKNLRFFLKSCSLRDRDPGTKLLCFTCHPWCCNVAPRARRRDAYWFSARDRARMRYWSVTSIMYLNSRIQSMSVFVLVEILESWNGRLFIMNR